MTKGQFRPKSSGQIGVPKKRPVCDEKRPYRSKKPKSRIVPVEGGGRNKLLETRLAVEKNDDAMQVRRQGRSIGLRVNFSPS